MKILILGNGYVGNLCAAAWCDEAIHHKERITSKDDVLALINEHNPDVVFNAAGVRGKPNVDWCEDHQLETILGNTKLPIMIAEACQETGKYLLHIGSGCVFYGDSTHEDKAWREDDFANPKPVYSRTKYAADLVLSTLPNAGVGRIRIPMHHEPSAGNIIDKLASFENIIDVENSITVIDDMISAFYQLMEKKGEGIFHVTNPGTVKHKDIIAAYNKYVDPDFAPNWISEADLVAKGLAAKGRSNNFLNSDRLEALGIHMRPIDQALEETMIAYAKHK